MTAGQDGFRDASSKHASGPQRPVDLPECLSSWIDRPHHLLILLQVPASAQRGTVVLFVVVPIAGRSLGGTNHDSLRCCIGFTTYHQLPGDTSDLVGQRHGSEFRWLAVEKVDEPG